MKYGLVFLLEMAIPVLAHRIVARHSGSDGRRPVTHSILEQILQRIPVPTEESLKEKTGV